MHTSGISEGSMVFLLWVYKKLPNAILVIVACTMNYLEKAVADCVKGDAAYLAAKGTYIQYYTCVKDRGSEDKRWHCINGIIDDTSGYSTAGAEKEIRLPRFIPPRLVYPEYVFHSYDDIAKRVRLNQTANKPSKE